MVCHKIQAITGDPMDANNSHIANYRNEELRLFIEGKSSWGLTEQQKTI